MVVVVGVGVVRGVGVVFGNRIVDASIFACLHVEVICAFKAVCVVCGCVFFVL